MWLKSFFKSIFSKFSAEKSSVMSIDKDAKLSDKKLSVEKKEKSLTAKQIKNGVEDVNSEKAKGDSNKTDKPKAARKPRKKNTESTQTSDKPKAARKPRKKNTDNKTSGKK